MTELIGRTFGRYHILEEIGQGGMATVYRALDLAENRPVALKVLAPHLSKDPKFRARFEREVRLQRDLNHPNIVPVLDFGEFDGYAYIVMPYLASGTLQERMQTRPPTPAEGARIIAQVAAALEQAHRQGVVHRDVKPSNILLDEQGNARLSDFGFAHLTDASVSLTGSMLIGTPAYMSPEQCRGDEIDARSDQYSLGVVLYQMCTGHLPFASDTPLGVVLKHANEPLPPPRAVNPNLPEAVADVLVTALSKDPNDRFASIAEMNAAFQESLAQSLDPNAPARSRRSERSTRTLKKPAPPVDARLGRWRRLGLAAAATALLVCPGAAWAFGVIPPGNHSGEASGPSASPDLMGTVYALATANAPGAGTVVSPGEVETAVAGTIAAMGIFAQGTEIPTFAPAAAVASPTPTGTLRLSDMTTSGLPIDSPPSSPTRSSPPSASSTPTPTPTATSGVGFTPTTGPSSTSAPSATDTPAPTAIPNPTDTPVPPTSTTAPPSATPRPPTSTPGPTQTPRIKCNPGHPCTPTPTA
jgi:serine/threonine protein kinase